MALTDPGAIVQSAERAGMLTSITVKVSWAPHPQDDDIVVKADLVPDPIIIAAEVLKATADFVTFKYQLEEGSKLHVRVQSRRGGIYSAPADFILTAPYEAPVAPSGVSVEII